MYQPDVMSVVIVLAAFADLLGASPFRAPRLQADGTPDVDDRPRESSDRGVGDMPKRALTAFLFVQAHSCSARRWNAEGSSRDAPRRSNRTAFGCRMALVAAPGRASPRGTLGPLGCDQGGEEPAPGGDTFLPAAQSVSTQAITIAAPTDKVRPCWPRWGTAVEQGSTAMRWWSTSAEPGRRNDSTDFLGRDRVRGRRLRSRAAPRSSADEVPA